MEPSREEIDKLPGPAVLEFGASWCPHCQAIQATMAEQLVQHPAVRHIQVEDGRGKPLGRSFRVKLWPTLVFLRDSSVIAQVVRPSPAGIAAGFAELVAANV